MPCGERGFYDKILVLIVWASIRYGPFIRPLILALHLLWFQGYLLEPNQPKQSLNLHLHRNVMRKSALEVLKAAI